MIKVEYLPFIFPIVIIVCIGIVIFIAYKLEKKRTEILRQVAMQKGFSFNPKTEKSYIDSLPKLTIFKKGHSKKLTNLIKGNKNSIAWSIFDYKFTVGHGKNSRTYKQTVALASLHTSLPNFYLGRENIFHKIGSKFGYQDIDFDNFPEFSDKYLLRGENETAVKNLFTSNILRFFQENMTNIYVEAEKNYLIYYRLSRRIKPLELDQFIEEATKVVRLFEKDDF